jgi:phage gp46-like protein
MTFQQGDVLLENTGDGGEITVENGVVKMTGRFDTAVYLSTHGGNFDDAGESDTTKTWWGNIDENIPERQYRSKTQYLLKNLPAISANIPKIQDAVDADLQWFLDTNTASSVVSEVTLPQRNLVQITVEIEAVGDKQNFSYTENWEAPQ